MRSKGACVSIIVPVIHEDRVSECISAIKHNAGIDEGMYEIITEVDTERIGCPKMVKGLVGKANCNLIMFLGDDTVPEKDFLKIALDKMSELPDGWGLVGLGDGINNGEILATHWLADTRLLEHLENNEFFFTGYKHQYCDRELTDIAKELGRYVWAKDSKLKHNHPIVDQKFDDEDYRKSYAEESARHDSKLYMKRKKARGYHKLGIGWPLTDIKVYTTFLVSWTAMEKPNFTLLMPHAPGPIDVIRNNLVVQALREGCTQLLMMDTDQNYPPDTILKLLSHKKDVVSVNVHRRYPPFDNILYRGELGNYYHVPDDECFSDKLIEIDATGCGCVLYNTDVFLDIPYPWFEIRTRADGRVVGEDIDFCDKLKKAGFNLYADTSIKVGHISVMEITREFYQLYKKIKGLDWRPLPEKSDDETLN